MLCASIANTLLSQCDTKEVAIGTEVSTIMALNMQKSVGDAPLHV